MIKNIYAFAIFFVAPILAGCGSSEQEYENTEYNGTLTENVANEQSPSGPSIPVSSDGASYQLISSQKMSNGNLEVVTRRDGPSGRSFARREIDCEAMTFRYLGEGDTLDQAMEDVPQPGDLSEAMATSISGEVARFACVQ